MTEVRFTGIVPFPREAVFDSFIDLRNWVHFSPGVESIDDVEGWGAPRGRCRVTIRVLGRRRIADCEMTEIQRPLQFRYLAGVEGQPTSTHDCRFTDAPDGTRVDISTRWDARHGVVGLFDRFPVRWALKRMLNRSMSSFAAMMAQRRGWESGSP